MTGPDVFLPQLRAGERVLWNAPASAAVRDAANRRFRRRILLWTVGSAIGGIFAIWMASTSGHDWLAQPGFSSARDALVWTALAALMLSLGVIGARIYLRDSTKRRITSDWHMHYVLTDQRLFYVDQEGELVDEIESHEVVAVELDEETSPPAILVERRTAEEEDKHLILMDLEQPHTAKAKIVETFLEPAP
jgi:hypothetical protein